MWNTTRARTQAAARAVVALGLTLTAVAAGSPETFKATAAVKSPKASASSPVTIRIDKFVSDADRERLMGVFKANDDRATREALAKMPDIGFVEVGGKRSPIKYAYARPSGGGRLITAVTGTPLLFLGGAAPDAKPREGFDFAIALLVLDAGDTGEGELAPAARVRVDANGAIVTKDYGPELVRLTSISKAK
jgi:hypothetical protein